MLIHTSERKRPAWHGRRPASADEDPYLINAGKQPVTLVTGGSFFHRGDSFAMMPGGPIDICVLGAFEVSVGDDLANWHAGRDPCN